MSRPLAELVKKGLLRSGRATVRGGHRKQLVYDLTDRGRGQLSRRTQLVPLLGNELPPPPNPFHGRREELRELRQLSGEGGALVVVEGPSGIGKTALVSRHIRGLRAGRVTFWFTIRPGNAPRHFVAALARALAGLKAPQLAYYAQLPRLPVGREVADLAQRALNDRELVAVIDDLHVCEPDMRKFLSEFLTAFMKGRHDQIFCIGQSGTALEMTGGVPPIKVVVGGLDRAAAHDLTDRLGGLAERFESVYQSCLGSPFLLKLAVSNPDLEATESGLPAAVVSRIPDETFQALIPLALANEPLSVEVLLEMGIPSIEDVDHLVDSGLLRHTAEGRVELLQTIRAALVNRAGPSLERTGHLRLAEFYSQSRRPESIRERLLHLVAGESFKEAIAILRIHERTVLNVGYSDALHASLRHLSLALPAGEERVLALRVEAALLQLHADYTEAILALRRAIVEAGEDRPIAADCLLRIADLYVRQNSVDRAEAALEAARRLGPFQRRLEAYMMLTQARITEAKTDWARAQELARDAYESSRRLRPPDVALESVALWSKLAALTGDREGSLQIVEEGLSDARKHGRLDIVFNLILVRARIYAERGDSDRAQAEMRAMRAEAEALGYLSPLTYTLSGLCALAVQAEQWDEALGYGRQAAALAERLGNMLVLGHTLGIMAACEIRMAHARPEPAAVLISAQEHAERAISVLQRITLTDSLVIAYAYLTEVYLDRQLIPQARAAFEESLRLAKELGMKWMLDQLAADTLPRLLEEEQKLGGSR
jgi:tetratricopeptide (TPR) repeat protein